MASAKGKKADSSEKKSNSGDKKKVVIGGFDGPKADQARKSVIAALKDDGAYDITDSADVKPGADDKAFAKAAGGASAVLVGTVKKGTGLTLSVHNGADGALVQDVEIKGDNAAKLSKTIDSTVAVSVADAISQTKPAAADSGGGATDEDKPKTEEESDKPKTDEESDKKPEAAAEDSGAEGPSPIDVTAGIRAVHRSFTYHDTPAQLYPQDKYPSPNTYTLPLGPAAYIEGTIYPLAFITGGIPANIGVLVNYEHGLATKSEYNTNQQLTTHQNQFEFGLRGRIPVGVNEFGVVAAYGEQIFNLIGDEKTPPGPFVPDIQYKFIRVGVDGRLRFDAFTIGAHLGTRIVSDTGDIKKYWFSNAKASSIEAGLVLGYTLIPHLDLVGGVDLLRYGFDFNPISNNQDPKTTTIAGGAVDQYVSGWIGVRYTPAGSHH